MYAHSLPQESLVRDSAAQTSDGDLIVQAPSSTSSASLLLRVCDPVGSSFGSRARFYSGIPKYNIAISLLGCCFSIPGSCGPLLCCMAVSATGVYRLAVEELREQCAERGLDSGGTVRALRCRLADHIKSDQVDGAQDQPVV
jgi:hypothetical protein